jgi:Protein of unknown function (DUF3592)
MFILIGILFALGGGLAMLAGLTGMQRVHRLRRDGVSAWAMAVPEHATAGDWPDGSPRRTLIQYALPDGRVLEQISPRPTRKAASLRPGEKILVWYDPEDPQDVLVFGREGKLADKAFVAVGAAFVLAGAAIAAFIR